MKLQKKLVRNNNKCNILNIVLAIAANKSDLYEHEEVPKAEGEAFAKKHNAIFQMTSAKDSNGSIDTLFKKIGKIFLNPKTKNGDNSPEEAPRKRGHTLDEQRNQDNKKGGCC